MQEIVLQILAGTLFILLVAALVIHAIVSKTIEERTTKE